MSNRLFQSVIHQMKDAVGGRIIGVIDETGVIIACSELVKIGEVRQNQARVYHFCGRRGRRGGYDFPPACRFAFQHQESVR